MNTVFLVISVFVLLLSLIYLFYFFTSGKDLSERYKKYLKNAEENNLKTEELINDYKKNLPEIV